MGIALIQRRRQSSWPEWIHRLVEDEGDRRAPSVVVGAPFSFDPNDISISDVETQSSDEHEPSDNANDDVHVDAQPSNDNVVEVEPIVDLDNPQSKNQRYDKKRLHC